MRYDDPWTHRPRVQRPRPYGGEFRGFRGGYDSIYQDRYRGRTRDGGRYDAGYGERGWWGRADRQGYAADFPPRHWGGMDPRERDPDRGYRTRGGGPGRGPGGFFRGGF
jgi:hypothetical protein